MPPRLSYLRHVFCPVVMPKSLLPFPSTDWTAISRASEQGEVARQALGELLDRYLPALRAYLASKWNMTPDGVAETLQSFVAEKVLEQALLRQAERARGRFRSFLLKSLDRYVIDQHRRRQASKRSSIEAESLDAEPDLNVPDAPVSDAFELAWAKQVLESAAARMRDECGMSGRPQLWDLFELRVIKPALEHAEVPPYEQLQERLGFASPEQASNMLITAKRMFLRALRSAVREYADDDADVEHEIVRLKQVLSRGG